MKRWWLHNQEGRDHYGCLTSYERFDVYDNGGTPVETSHFEKDHLDHYPVLDIDMDVWVTPSKTEGHHHLVINRPMSWRKYRKLLKALKKAGIIGPEWYRVSLDRRFSMVVRQPPSP